MCRYGVSITKEFNWQKHWNNNPSIASFFLLTKFTYCSVESTSSILYIKNETTKQTISFPKVLKKISIPWEFHGTSLSKLKLRELFYEKNWLSISCTLHLRCNKAFSSFLTISEDPLDKFFHFWLNIFAWSFQIVWCKIKKL